MMLGIMPCRPTASKITARDGSEPIPMLAERCRELTGTPSSAKSGKPVPSAGSKTMSAPSCMASARRDGDRSEALIGLAPRHFRATMIARPIGPQPTT